MTNLITNHSLLLTKSKYYSRDKHTHHVGNSKHVSKFIISKIIGNKPNDCQENNCLIKLRTWVIMEYYADVKKKYDTHSDMRER